MEYVLQVAEQKEFSIKLDPRCKLLLLVTIAIVMVSGKTVGVEGVLRAICAAVPFLLLLTIKRFQAAAVYVLLLGSAIFCENQIVPHTSGIGNLVLMMICGIITRFGTGYMMGWYTVNSTSVSEFITAMERMHFPYFITIPMSVMFRYFPTLSEEYKAISDAKKMREIGHPLKHPLAYIEYILVPMMMSSVRIADELSAASLTKGLSTGSKRTHICQIGIRPLDVLMMIGAAAMLVLFFVY
ncbi:MAG: energy-coupling factor transporter transmembrane protein EcfT [Ruminococcus sp.]|uniref:energy-coupling factor transporter transmembrane component T n=1 Tax=Ruminococcus sp. TaxID=41978 RepID=UPI0025E43B48|nr:energy-coupling factor transporter transmembrane component T [Ruminococcus sp.]MCR5540504.1 energy-coupling factor transporter transmembrane protein EcfT [Ruminococcus sp.]